MADLAFAKYTNAILDMLPHWFQIRKDSENSIGARFLNVSGLKLDDIRYVLDYAYDQCYISTADIGQIDFCYKSIIPMPYKSSNISKVTVNGKGLIKAKNIKQFFGIDQNGIRDVALASFDFYYVDEIRNIIYVRKKFNVDALYDNGKINIVYKDGKENIMALIPHQVWNFFDELGILVSCERLPEEPNVEYKKRILDVFTNKANSSRDGLINGIGRELTLRKVVYWSNPERDLELEDAMIVLNSIKVNNQHIDMSNIYLTAEGTVLIKSPDKDTDLFNLMKGSIEPVVSYVHGLEMHELHNKNDIKLYNELFTVEGKAKTKLKQYIDILNSESPIFWGDFHWNEHYWNQNEKDVSGLGTIPHLYDGSIKGFRNYKK